MCSRYELSTAPVDLMALFGLKAPPPRPNTPDVRPTDIGLIQTSTESLLRPWGFAVTWTRQPMINARAETLTEKPTFRPYLATRCLVPASAYFEWRKTDLGQKLKNRIGLASDAPFCMAGLYSADAFTVITCPPCPSIAHIHNRMPVLLDPKDWDHWIDPTVSFSEVQDLLKPTTVALKAEEDTPPPPPQGDLFH